VVDGRIPVGYKQLHAAVEVGHRLLIADGKIEAVVSDLQGSKIYATVKVPGVLFSHKGLNIPDTTKRIDAITEKDIADAQFGAQHGVDYIAVSFVTKPEDIAVVRKAIAPYDQGDTPIRCIAKIERAEAVHRIDDILDVVDGIMVARGDLGVEVRAAEVPILQKDLIAKARAAYKPVIVATQMLDSMTDNPRPTRAEVSDVANAVIDHTDAVMLSNETATGSYPLEAVQIMSETIHEAEHSLYDDMTGKIGEQVAQLKATLAAKQGTGIYIADPQKYLDVLGAHPDVPLVVVAPSVRAARQWNLYWGVLPILADNDLETQYAALQAIGHRIDQLIPIEELL
jgi:pyruvate kinase